MLNVGNKCEYPKFICDENGKWFLVFDCKNFKSYDIPCDKNGIVDFWNLNENDKIDYEIALSSVINRKYLEKKGVCGNEHC